MCFVINEWDCTKWYRRYDQCSFNDVEYIASPPKEHLNRDYPGNIGNCPADQPSDLWQICIPANGIPNQDRV